MASVLLWAALEKIRSPSSLADTLRRIGVPMSIVGSTAALLVTAELTVALGMIMVPGSLAVIAGLLALATAFAIAGVLAVTRHEQIHCGCFGTGGNGYLGKRQLGALPFWVAGATLLWIERPGNPTLSDGAALFTLVSLTMTALRTTTGLRVTSAARADRLSAMEMMPWLRR